MKQNFEFLEKADKKLKYFYEILLKWQKKINLISDSTIKDGWNRHILDSAQLYPLILKEKKVLVDVGSGAGFPGMVIAILNNELKGGLEKIYLIESNLKKCLFLKEVSRLLNVPVIILNERIEKVILKEKVDVITSRALASTKEILKMSKSLISQETQFLLLKGGKVEDEIKELKGVCKIEKIKSLTFENGYILKIEEFKNDE